jgi:hypothetical protein
VDEDDVPVVLLLVPVELVDVLEESDVLIPMLCSRLVSAVCAEVRFPELISSEMVSRLSFTFFFLLLASSRLLSESVDEEPVLNDRPDILLIFILPF